MAIDSFPWTITEWWAGLRVRDVDFWLDTYQTQTGFEGGQVVVTQLARPKWRLRAVLAPLRSADAARVLAQISTLRTRGGTFRAHDMRHEYPAADPGGSIVGSSSVTLGTLDGATGTTFSGLPDDYVLTIGDPFTVTDGSGIRNLHVIAEGLASGWGFGETSSVEVTPPFRPTVEAGDSVDFRRAAATFRIIPGTVSAGTVVARTAGKGAVEGIGFEAIEVLA